MQTVGELERGDCRNRNGALAFINRPSEMPLAEKEARPKTRKRGFEQRKEQFKSGGVPTHTELIGPTPRNQAEKHEASRGTLYSKGATTRPTYPRLVRKEGGF